jgi:hypothetical protein
VSNLYLPPGKKTVTQSGNVEGKALLVNQQKVKEN